MGHRDDSSLEAGSAPAPADTSEARSLRTHEAFETYYAEREHRRLAEEALARRTRVSDVVN